ncbi:MAG: hypothetical protein CMD48_03515 [Gammaproteobacteria bacterium]|nr:hypothetical protein [Gammaproteobacteria bacterium]
MAPSLIAADSLLYKCTYFESYNWKTQELKEVSKEPFSLEIDKSLKEIEFKKVKFPYVTKGNSILWEVLYPQQDRGAKFFVGDEIEFDMQLGSFKRHFKFLELEKSFEEMNGAERSIAIEVIKRLELYELGSTHSAYCEIKKNQ